MVDNLELIRLERRNFLLRIIIIVVLIFIAVAVLYFKFGYVDIDDVGIIDEIGRNISCEEALIYYAESEWGYKYKDNILISPLNLS